MLASRSIIISVETVLQKYKLKKYNFIISDSLQCIMCKSILIDAVQTDCGCRYCKNCIDNYLCNGQKECIGESEECRSLINKYICDKATNKEISQLKVKCLYEGCIFEDFLRNISQHLETCKYRIETCVLCEITYIENEKENHLTKECPMREISCPHCNKYMTYKEFTENQLNIEKTDLCSEYEAICPYNCGITTKENVLKHRKICEKKPHECPYRVFGCNELIPNDEMDNHLHTKCHHHSLTVVGVLEKLKKYNEEMEDQVKELRAENGILKKSIETMKSEFEKKIDQIEKNHKKKEPIVKSRTIFRNGKFLWKIKEFSKLKDDAMNGVNLTIISDPFYTSEFGYKMCMKIYPNGDGMGKGTHLSVFFVIMKGEYDDLLSWPFRNKVNLTLIDEFSKSNNHSDIFKPDARSVCYQKPEDEFNIASGSPRFIPFSDLTNFLKNDSLYIQITVLP